MSTKISLLTKEIEALKLKGSKVSMLFSERNLWRHVGFSKR